MSVTSEAPAAFRNAAARPTPLGLLTEAIRDITSRRRLVRYLVQAEIKKRGANTLLGNIWWILPWKWFTSAVTDATGSIVNQHRLIKQIAFPKIVLPVAATTAGVVGFAFGLIPLAAIMLLYPHRLSALILLIPIIAVVQYVFTVAVAILVAAGNVFFRDLGNVVRHLLRLWWYLSPGLYALSHLDGIALFENPVLRFIAHANPFAVLFEAYRSVIYGTAEGAPMPPDWSSLVILLVASTVFLAIASVAFKRLEPTFAKVL